MRAERALDLLSVDPLRAGPALGRDEHDHRPARPRMESLRPRFVLDRADVGEHAIERRRHRLVHRHRIVAFDEPGRVAEAGEVGLELGAGDSRQHRRARDLVAVEMQDRQHRAVARRIEELVRLPACGERSRFCLAVADDAGHQQFRIVEGGAVRMRERVAELAALVNRPGRFRGDVARDAAGKGKLLEEVLHPGFVLRHLRIALGVGAFEIGVGDERRTAVPGPGDEKHGAPLPDNHAIEVRVDEIEAGRRAPVAEQARLDVVERERHPEQRVVVEIDLSHGEVIGRAPVGVKARECFRRRCG